MLTVILYNFSLLLYRTGALLLSPWNPKAKLWVKGRERLLEKIRSDAASQQSPDTIWMHCASLGEFEQGRPIIEHIRAINSKARIVITFFSASGYEVRKNYEGADYIYYLPSDSYNNAVNFIEAINPKLVLWVKYEYWYFYLTELKKRNIPVLLLSAIFRENQLFFRWYGGFYRKMLRCFSHIFVQDEDSKRLLNIINLSKNVTTSGDTRFDRVIDIAEKAASIPVITSFCGDHQVIIAGSTWREDEEELDHFANSHPEIKFIIAPHEIDSRHLKEIKTLFKRSIFFSEWETRLMEGAILTGSIAPNVLIIDNIGMLSRLYRYATIAYIGGGFGADGLHNVLEAAVYGKPVVFGPVHDKFPEARELIDRGGAFSVSNALEVEKKLSLLLTNSLECAIAGESAKSYVYENRGAKDKIIRYLIGEKLV